MVYDEGAQHREWRRHTAQTDRPDLLTTQKGPFLLRSRSFAIDLQQGHHSRNAVCETEK